MWVLGRGVEPPKERLQLTEASDAASRKMLPLQMDDKETRIERTHKMADRGKHNRQRVGLV